MEITLWIFIFFSEIEFSLYKSLFQSTTIFFSGSDDFDQVLKALLANNMFVGSFTALFLDNILPGTPEERGITVWAEVPKTALEYDYDDDGAGSLTLKSYDFPFGMRYLRKMRWPKYVPFMPGFEGFACFRRCRKGSEIYEFKSKQ